MTNPNQALFRGAFTALALTTFLLTGACGAAATPQPLLDARASYKTAAEGPAGRLTPAELVDAKQALDEAEQSFEDDGASDETLDAAYIAQRRAQIANARGGIAEAEEAAMLGKAELAMVQEGRLQTAESALTATRGQVERKDRQLAATDAELRATDRALVSEQKGRAEAEHRANAAMDKLALAAAPVVKDEPRGAVIMLPGNVLFATGQFELLPGAKSKLDAVAVALKDPPDVGILVGGHTDSQGTAPDNMQLAERRGESVRAYLQSKGVPKEQLSSVGIGEDRPIGDNKTIDGRAQNRRVEIIVSPREKALRALPPRTAAGAIIFLPGAPKGRRQTEGAPVRMWVPGTASVPMPSRGRAPPLADACEILPDA